jgi:hypothetical protein
VTGNAIRKATDGISDFLRLESAGGLLLVAATLIRSLPSFYLPPGLGSLQYLKPQTGNWCHE